MSKKKVLDPTQLQIAESETPVAAASLSGDHLRQVELASMETKVYDGLVKLAEEKLKTKRMATRVIELEALISTHELTEAKQSYENIKKKYQELLSSLKNLYQLPDRWSYHPDTGEITRED